ncbi:PIN domain-containing protein [Vibrio diabolicus]|uniref:DUF4935 domain-containing protein n=1 Tax=Vibrio diabolicus TaxID=50719 RepID=A0ABN5HFJ8_9VIBR|nr:PIN domain-containing protein [Vibrio diabolicus]AVH25910.1 DUF4935 domain-containing protein [Vibrio diabolicus]
MKVFLDTNVFFKNWYVDNPNFKWMFRYLNNEQEELLLSELVVLEVENIRNRQRDEAIAEIKKQYKNLNGLSNKSVNFDNGIDIEDYDLNLILNDKAEFIDRIDFESISHKTLVHRAFKSVKPFSGQEKGYRDSLIWLSLVEYLKSCNENEEIAFITNNKTDFFVSKNKEIRLHPDLVKDLEENGIKSKVVPYTDLFQFVNSVIDKDDHLVDELKLSYELDDFLMEQTEEHMESLSKQDLSQYFATNVFKDKITQILDLTCETWDGVDDTEILSVSKISDDEAYVSCHYVVTGLDLTVAIDVIEYNQHKDDIDSISECYQVVIDHENEIANISLGFRAWISGSLIYKVHDELPAELHVENVELY